MSIYLDLTVQVPQSAIDCSVIHIKWSDNQKTLAVSTSDSCIRFYTECGILRDDFTFEGKPNTLCYCLAWRKKSKVIALGWNDGTIALWRLDKRACKKDVSLHCGSRVFDLSWSPEGTRLLSIDFNGIIGIWKTDYQDRITLTLSYDIKKDCFGENSNEVNVDEASSFISCFCWQCDSVYQANQKDIKIAPAYIFVGTETGKIINISSTSSKTSVYDFNKQGAVANLHWNDLTCQLVEITYLGIVNVYNVNITSTKDVKLLRCQEVNLSWGNDLLNDQKTRCLKSILIQQTGILVYAVIGTNHFRSLNFSNSRISVLSSNKKDQPSVLALSECGSMCTRGLVTILSTGKMEIWRLQYQSSSGDNIYSYSLEQTIVIPKSTKAFCSRGNSNESSEVFACAFTKKSKKFAVKLFSKAKLLREIVNDTAAVQISAYQINIFLGASILFQHTTGISVKGLKLTQTHVLVWNSYEAEVYSLRKTGPELLNKLEDEVEAYTIVGEHIYKITGDSLCCCNLEGAIKSKIIFSEAEGMPSVLNSNNDVILVVTKLGFYSTFYAHSSSLRSDQKGFFINDVLKYFSANHTDELYQKVLLVGNKTSSSAKASLNLKLVVREAKVNVSGSIIATTLDIYNGNTFLTPINSIFFISKKGKTYIEHKMKENAFVSCFFWDKCEEDVVLLEINTEHQTIQSLIIVNALEAQVLEEKFVETKRTLLGFKLPFYFEIARDAASVQFNETKNAEEDVYNILTLPFQMFADLLEEIHDDISVKRTLLNFSVHLKAENANAAYDCVKFLKSRIVWKKLTVLCIMKKELKLALNAVAKLEDNHFLLLALAGKFQGISFCDESKLAFLAVAFNKQDFGENILLKSGRYDLLNVLFQAQGHFEKALHVASTKDKLHLNLTHYKYAKYLEYRQRFDEAADHYHETDVALTAIPFMYLQNKRLDRLEFFIRKCISNKSKHMIPLARWLGCYYESLKSFDIALSLYKKVEDFSSIVRLECANGGFKKASEIIKSRNFQNDEAKKVAHYTLAKRFEEKGRFLEAIAEYDNAGRYASAIRVARNEDLFEELFRLGKLAPRRLSNMAAKYLFKKGYFEKAAMLYRRNESVTAALQICLDHKLFELVGSISSGLLAVKNGNNTVKNESVISNCIIFFEKNDQFENVVKLLLLKNKKEKALEVVESNGVKLNNELVEKLIPSSEDFGERERKTIILKIGKICEDQKLFHLSTKLYMKIGEKILAMKSLIDSGNKAKVLFFAKQAKKKDVYILAGNFLQTLNWRKEPTVLKDIEWCFTKAKDFSKLAQFYHNCAQEEVVSYNSFINGLQAIKKAQGFLVQAEKEISNDDHQKQKLHQISVVLEERKVILHHLTQLQLQISAAEVDNIIETKIREILDKIRLNTNNLSTFFNLGDIYGEYIKYLTICKKDNHHAYEVLCQMEGEDMPFVSFVEEKIVKEIVKKTEMKDFSKKAYCGNSIIDQSDESIVEGDSESIDLELSLESKS